jgi:hypothetical protein
MTKAKARQRAKANAAKKIKRKRAAAAEQPDQKIRPGHFDSGPGSISSPAASVNTKNLAGGKRGSARSR